MTTAVNSANQHRQNQAHPSTYISHMHACADGQYLQRLLNYYTSYSYLRVEVFWLSWVWVKIWIK